MLDFFHRIWSDESGQGLTEYALIVGLVSVGLIVILVAFRQELGRVFNAIIDELQGAGPTQEPVT